MSYMLHLEYRKQEMLRAQQDARSGFARYGSASRTRCISHIWGRGDSASGVGEEPHGPPVGRGPYPITPILPAPCGRHSLIYRLRA